ncbi:MAG: hypothetical protein IKU55_04345, partial [Clostridia bacterium]|nr:hypothetical protein [Clostridia bacterium]
KYISFGEPESMQYLRLPKTWWEEPEAITTPRIEHHVGPFAPGSNRADNPKRKMTKLERVSSILGYYHAPVTIVIDGLVPAAAYELRIVFPMRFNWEGQPNIPTYITVGGKRLEALGCVADDPWVYRYAVPAGVVDANGTITLEIERDEGPRGSGASEIWMLLQE